MYKIGDIVTRNSYQNDVLFKIIKIEDNNYYLKGINIRLVADSPQEDLKKETPTTEEEENISFDEYLTLDRDEYFYLPGKVLHIDGDREYLQRCMHFYNKNSIKVYGVYCNETELSSKITECLEKYKPNILVITGHDALYKRRKDDRDYKNTNNFIDAVKTARLYEPDHDKLLIIAGACQSDYEELIKSGANFASSPKRINIHALDPAIIATSLAFSDHNKNIDLINIINKTKYKKEGIGGIITKGTMYIGYPRE